MVPRWLIFSIELLKLQSTTVHKLVPWSAETGLILYSNGRNVYGNGMGTEDVCVPLVCWARPHHLTCLFFLVLSHARPKFKKNANICILYDYTIKNIAICKFTGKYMSDQRLREAWRTIRTCNPITTYLVLSWIYMVIIVHWSRASAIQTNSWICDPTDSIAIHTCTRHLMPDIEMTQI